MHLPPPASRWDPAEPSPPAAGGHGGPLLGGWAAVRWEYTRADGSRRVDVIADLGGAVTLSLSDADYVLSCALRAEPTRSAAGALRVVGDEWIDFSPRTGNPERVEFRRAAGTLVLRSDASAWDFTGAGEEPASFTAVLVRL
jgi:hypothetical protein